jgi:hypothetical protein
MWEWGWRSMVVITTVVMAGPQASPAIPEMALCTVSEDLPMVACTT